MELNEVLETICGDYEGPIGKATGAMSIFQLDGEDLTETANVVAINAKYEILARQDNIQVDIIFPSGNETECNQLWDFLEKYRKLLHESSMKSPSSESEYLFALVLTPLELEGTCALSFMNPLFWTLQPERPSSSNHNVIRILFPCDTTFLEDNMEVDIDKISAEEERGIQEEQRQLDIFMQEKEKRNREQVELMTNQERSHT